MKTNERFEPENTEKNRIDGNKAFQDGNDHLVFVHSATPITESSQCNQNVVYGADTAGSGRSRRVNEYRDLVPLRLRTPEFLEAWDEWVENRIELGKKHRWPVTELSFRKTLKKCEKWGIKRAIAAIDFSIEYGYRGLFESRHSQEPEPDTYKPGSSFRGRGG